jgi:Yip1 domain
MMPTSTYVNASLIARIKNILRSPKTEWPVIDAESTDVAKLYREYIGPLSAIPVICSFIGMTLIGVTLPFVGTYRTPILNGFAHAIVQYVLALAGVYVSAIIIEKLAPTFDSTPNRLQALKLVAYASTPMWIAGVLNLIPALGILVIFAAFYAIYLFYLGLPILMKTPEPKVIPYIVVAAVVMFVVFAVIGLVAAALTGVSAGARFA